MVRSAFMGTFGEEAMKWLSLLTAPQYDYIVAIARKCPRLIDVILRESKTFSPSIWDKVITEHALPFHFAQMPPKHNYLLIDDSVFYGSTFKKIETLIKNLNNISQSENANECNKINIKNATLFLLENNRLENLNINMYFRTGNEQQAVTFVNYEMSAFLKGGPYDLESLSYIIQESSTKIKYKLHWKRTFPKHKFIHWTNPFYWKTERMQQEKVGQYCFIL